MRKEMCLICKCLLYHPVKQSSVSSNYNTFKGKEISEWKPNLSLASCVATGKLQIAFLYDTQPKSPVVIVPCSSDASDRECEIPEREAVQKNKVQLG